MYNWGGPPDNLSIALMTDGLSPNELALVAISPTIEYHKSK